MTGLADFVSSLAGAVPTVLSVVGSICTAIVGTPFLSFTVLFLFIGGCVGIFGRLLSRN